MKTTIQHKLAAAIIAMLPAALSAQEHIEADIGADIVSGYIWRGQDLGNISIQPSASISYKGIWLSGWGTVGFDKDDTKEFDLTVGYSIKKSMNLSIRFLSNFLFFLLYVPSFAKQ